MFTLSLSYVFIYLLILLNVLIITLIFLPTNLLTQTSITQYLVFIQRYTTIRTLFLSLIFALTGLPPVGLFFVKFNILSTVLYRSQPAVIIAIFLVFFLNMLYYIQLFNIKNFKLKIYNLINIYSFSTWHSDFKNKTFGTNYNTYRWILYSIKLLSCLYLTLIIYSDFYLILMQL